jgi:copper chaperone CopZ
VPGARKVDIKLKKKVVRVQYDKKRVTVADLIKALKKAGFRAKKAGA